MCRTSKGPGASPTSSTTLSRCPIARSQHCRHCALHASALTLDRRVLRVRRAREEAGDAREAWPPLRARRRHRLWAHARVPYNYRATPRPARALRSARCLGNRKPTNVSGACRRTKHSSVTAARCGSPATHTTEAQSRSRQSLAAGACAGWVELTLAPFLGRAPRRDDRPARRL